MHKKISELNIMVTGCGGDIGYGIGKILRNSHYGKLLIGTDINHDHGGTSMFDQCLLVPRADSKNYIDKLRSLLVRYKIDIILPASEPEIKLLSGLRTISAAKIITANKKAIEIGGDKLETVNFLQSIGAPFPWTKIVQDGEPNDLPCVVKSRSGSGSSHVYIATKDNFDRFQKNYPEYIWQELLMPENQECTCGLFRSENTGVRTIVFKRKLSGGHTVSGETINDSRITRLLTNIANGLALEGSVNIQLRLTKRGPVVFEINPRFSSTLVFRHLLGFQDVIWSINNSLGIDSTPYNEAPAGTHIYRYSNEIIIPNPLKQSGSK